MRIKNLAGVFTGEGFAKKLGRQVAFDDCGFKSGPLNIETNSSGVIASLAKASSTQTSGADAEIDASGCIAVAGFVDSHTHALFCGTRSKEYFQRWQGLSYKEVSDLGGGIHNTVLQTSLASSDDLADALVANAKLCLQGGTTTLEVKSGYGKSAEAELKILRAIKQVSDSLASQSLPEILPTFLALHALPKGQKEVEFVDSMIAVLKTIAQEKLAFFVDAFPEKGFFSLEQSQRFTDAAESLGFKSKIHADELSDLGTSAAYCRKQALSIDHLQKISEQGIAALVSSKTVATLLPATSFYLDLEYTDARKLLKAGARVALATDFNPGTAPNPSMPFTATLAASKMKMSSAEILCATTYNAAGALGRDHDRGLLVPNYKAHLNLYRCTTSNDGQQSLEEILVCGLKPWRTVLGNTIVDTSA